MDTSNSLNKCLRQLEDSSTPCFNDRSYPLFVKYINGLLEHFGKERVYLVGSTTENLKLTWSKDGGDHDFLFLSGKLEIPVENIEVRDDTPCYIWVKVDKSQISETISLIDGKYLPSDVIRRVDPELFTIVRGIYLLMTCGSSYVPRNTIRTAYGLPSKVGLAFSEYRNLKVDGMSLSKRRCLSKRQVLTRDKTFRAYINKRKRESELYRQDAEKVERVMEFISCMTTPGSVGARLGYFEHFAYLVRLFQERSKESSLGGSLGEKVDSHEETNTVTFENDLESADDPPPKSGLHVSSETMEFEESRGKIRATYTERTCKDFVPALKIIGPLDCMAAWKSAQHMWLSQGEIDVIAKMDVFCVARYAPVNPSRKDFCLSFTLAETKLSECLSPVQRHIVLIMKAFLKGIFTKRHKQRDRELNLTTFHVKTVIYRVSDITEPSLWSEVNVIASLTRVLNFLKGALEKKELMHYFIPSNLFVGFEDDDYKILIECTDEVMSDPIGGLQAFFELDDGVPNELWLTKEEVAYLERISTDGGVSEEVDKVEEFVVELLRGLKDGPRDAHGNAPIKEAIATVLDMFIRDEEYINFREDAINVPPRTNKLFSSLGPLMIGAFGGILTKPIEELLLKTFENALEPNSEENKNKAFETLKYILVAYFSR